MCDAYSEFATGQLQTLPLSYEVYEPLTVDPAWLQYSTPSPSFPLEREEQEQEEVLPQGPQPYEVCHPLTVSPAWLQHSPSIPIFPEEQEEQEQLPLGTNHQNLPLELSVEGEAHIKRHIRNTLRIDKKLVPLHPCTECAVRSGSNGFSRLDNLKQHLRSMHGFRDEDLAARFPTRQTPKLTIAVCHVVGCEYSRVPEFVEWSIDVQHDNRPFAKQADYTKHMKLAHDYSPYPCTTTGCDKVGRNGYFSITALEKHRQDKHSENATVLVSVAHGLPSKKTLIVRRECFADIVTATN
ncbi:hypothetical protein F4777DRAFT_580919 [Nemania sp. FL0916]|nr:hypothetical protein F4777DRAFT_580919 [Nemania sp. FL0916]